MTQYVPLIPDNAPFTPVQRAWLNGFLAGLLGPEPNATPVLLPMEGAIVASPEDEDMPWHDPALSLEERLDLAKGKKPARLLMAAMAQLDCGQCGYLCQTYSEKLAEGAEKRTNLCQPGGKETARKVKELLGQLGTKATAGVPMDAPISGSPVEKPARFLGSLALNAPGAEKNTRHVMLSLKGSGLSYEVGDSLGVHVANCPELAAAVLGKLNAAAGMPVALNGGRKLSLADALRDHLDIARPSDAAMDYLSSISQGESAAKLKALAAGEDVPGWDEADLLDLLELADLSRLDIQALVSVLDPLRPRLYSIASSPKAHPGEVHLTVGVVGFEQRGRRRKGVASTHLAERVAKDACLQVYIQKAHGFHLPVNPMTPIVMVGPGTGIAPFRAFLEERAATGAKGRNWLFFGNPKRATDFLYEEQLTGWVEQGFLTRLDTAFSRDQARKIYVQDRIREAGAELWHWLADGAHLYICGDAKRMARDVDQALADIIAQHGGMDASAAKSWLARLGRDGRYQRDVY